MPSYLFSVPLFLLLVFFCALCDVVSANSSGMKAELFKKNPFDAFEPKGVFVERLDVRTVLLPSLVSANGVMVAVARGRRINDRHDILTKYIGTEGENWGDRAIEDNGKNWEAQVVLKGKKKKEIAFASVAKNKSIYVLSVSKAQPTAPPSLQQQQVLTNTKTWDVKLSVGTITGGEDAVVKRKIEWDTQNISDRFLKNIQRNLSKVHPLEVKGFLTENKTVVFVVRGRKDDGKYVFVIAHSKNKSSDFNVHYVTSLANCYSSFFSWGQQLFMVPRHCFSVDRSDYRLKESNDMGKTWGEASGPLAEKLNSLTKGRDSFTTITIEGRRVLLFTERRSKHHIDVGKVNLSLFLADEEHVEEIGPIAIDVASVYAGSLCYKNDELFFLNTQGNPYYLRVVLTRLKEQLEKIKKLLKEWYAVDEEQAVGLKEHSLNVSSPEESHADKSEKHLVHFSKSEENSTEKQTGFVFNGSGSNEESAKGSEGLGDGSVRAPVGVAVVLLICVFLGM